MHRSLVMRAAALALSAAWLVPSSAPAAPRSTLAPQGAVSAPAGTAIPFELVDNHVALPVSIDGKGPFRFVFDTGASNIIDADVARSLGLRTFGSGTSAGVGEAREPVQFARVDSLAVGGEVLHAQRFVVASIHDGFGASSGKPLDGLIGSEVLFRYVTTFDYEHARVVLYDRDAAPPASPAAHVVPLTFAGTQPRAPCTIAGIATSCVIDTGSRLSLSVLEPFIADHPAVVPPDATAVGADGFGIGGAARGRLGRTTLELGGFTVPDVVTDLSVQTRGAFAVRSHGGNIGAGVLKRFTVTFDYAHRTMTLEPNAHFADRDVYDRSGAFLIDRGGTVEVIDVRPGTPAADAGVVAGDAIATVDGTRAPGLSGVRERFLGPPGTPVVLGLTGRGGAPRTVTLVLRDYV
jgi:hypothetical protein